MKTRKFNLKAIDKTDGGIEIICTIDGYSAIEIIGILQLQLQDMINSIKMPENKKDKNNIIVPNSKYDC